MTRKRPSLWSYDASLHHHQIFESSVCLLQPQTSISNDPAAYASRLKMDDGNWTKSRCAQTRFLVISSN